MPGDMPDLELSVCVGSEREGNGVGSITTHQSSEPHKPFTYRPTTKTPTQPSPHACWGGRGEAWKLAERSFTVATLAFLTAEISITQTEIRGVFSNSTQQAVFFWVGLSLFFSKERKIGRIFFTAEVIRFHFSVTVAFEWNKWHKTNRFSFPSHFPCFIYNLLWHVTRTLSQTQALVGVCWTFWGTTMSLQPLSHLSRGEDQEEKGSPVVWKPECA